jgi:hypothetical protein
MNNKDEQTLWIEFAKAAIQSYEIPEDIDKLDDLVDDIADLSGMVADAMIEEFKERFEKPRRGERPRRRRDRDEEPEQGD